MAYSGAVAPSGTLQNKVIRGYPKGRAVTLWDLLYHGLPHFGVPKEVREWRIRNLRHFVPGFLKVALAKTVARITHLPVMYGTLALKVIYKDGRVLDLGVAGLKVVTTAGVNFIVDAFQNSVEVEDLKYHGIGTAALDAAEAVGDTALETELTTEYTGNVRATGTTTEGATANVYRTVGTNTMDEAPGAAIDEHGIFDQAATGGGTLLDRTLFADITLGSGDSLQSTYDLTFTAGS